MTRSTLQIVALVPTDFHHCAHCEVAFEAAGIGQPVHTQQINEYPDEDKAAYARLSDWLRAAVGRYGTRLRVHLIDAHSVEGFWLALRYRARTYPLYILDGERVAVGGDPARLDKTLQDRLGPAAPRPKVPDAAGSAPAGGV
jgi:hypothetical protein